MSKAGAARAIATARKGVMERNRINCLQNYAFLGNFAYMKHYKVCMTVAGHDPSGGAGIGADLKVFTLLGCYGQSVPTALTVQNSRGVRRNEAVSAALVYDQMDAAMGDLRPDAVKIGIVPTPAVGEAIARALRKHAPGVVVFDPVMISSSGLRLAGEESVRFFRDELMPLCTLITPNLPEARCLLAEERCLPTEDCSLPEETQCLSAENRCLPAEGRSLTAEERRQPAEARRLSAECDGAEAPEVIAERLSKQLGGTAVLVKGGHRTDGPTDVLFADGHSYIYKGRQIDSRNTHGTGCVLSSAIAAFAAQGAPLPEAVRRAKRFLTQRLETGAAYFAGEGKGGMYLLPED